MKRFTLLALALLTLFVFAPMRQIAHPVTDEQSSISETPSAPTITDSPLGHESSVTATVSDSDPKLSDGDLVIQTLERACQVELDALWTFDTSEFSSVYINDPRFPVSPDTLRFVRRITKDESLAYVGYLDFRLAERKHYHEGVRKWNAIAEKMKAENRTEMTEDERLSLISPSGDVYPAPPPPPDVVMQTTSCAYAVQSIDIEGDIAIVVASKGATTDEWYLVNRDGRWYIAGRKILIMHP